MYGVEYLSWVFVLFAVGKIIWALVCPAIMIIAAVKLWSCVARWIPVAFIVSAVSSLFVQLLFLIARYWSLAVYGRISIYVSLVNWTVGIFFALAVLALACEMKRMKTAASEPKADEFEFDDDDL